MSKVKDLLQRCCLNIVGIIAECILLPFVVCQYIWLSLKLLYWANILHLSDEECASRYTNLYNKMFNQYEMEMSKEKFYELFVTHSKHH